MLQGLDVLRARALNIQRCDLVTQLIQVELGIVTFAVGLSQVADCKVFPNLRDAAEVVVISVALVDVHHGQVHKCKN